MRLLDIIVTLDLGSSIRQLFRNGSRLGRDYGICVISTSCRDYARDTSQ
jgi:hypothetical protein